jgi:hypothetical protein
MPWVHGEGAGRAHTGGISPDDVSSSGLPPWLGDITVQETLQTTPAPLPPDPAEMGLEGIEPFVPPSSPDQAAAPSPMPEVAPDWLESITGPEQRAPVEPVLRRGDLSAVLVPGDTLPAIHEPVVRDIPVRPPREGAIETLAALVAPTAPEAARWAVPGVERESDATVERGRGLARFLPDGLIYLLVLAALLAVLLVRPTFGDVPAPRAAGVQAFYDAVDRVGSSGVVLVVYDWDATRSGEMALLAESVTRHLMSRRLRFVTISTMPQGPGFAQMVTDRVRGDYPGYEYGRDYLVLGYLPGGQAGLAALMTNYRRTLPRDYRDGRNPFTSHSLFGDDRLENLESYALIVNLAADEAELRGWIEQVGTRTDVPMVAAVPQGLEPIARPYLNIPRSGLSAIVSGPSGALQYTKLMEQRGLQAVSPAATSPTLTDRLNGQAVASMLVALVILAALVSMVIPGRRKA